VKRSRQDAQRHGHRAETIALWYLRLKGYRLLERRFKTKLGEIDLVMRKGDTTVFIEVKARATVDDSLYAVSTHAARRIASAAALYATRDEIAAKGFQRFDIVAVPSYLWPTHIENAFDGKY
jgi:putative endonuclease